MTQDAQNLVWVDMEMTGLDPDTDRVLEIGSSYKVKDGRTVEFVIAQRVPQLVLVRPDEKLQFVFAAEQAGRLFAPSRKK